jgi:hypothetical protein
MSTALAAIFTNESVDLFGINALDNQMLNKHRPITTSTQTVNADWVEGPGWRAIGGTFTSAPIATYRSQQLLTSPGSGHTLDVFGKGKDNLLYQLTRVAAADWNPNFPWMSLPDVYARMPSVVCSVVDPAHDLSRLDAFGVGTENSMFHVTSYGSSWAPGSDWALGGRFTSSPVAVNGPNLFDVFALASDNHILHRGFDGNVWTPSWEPLGVGLFTSPPAVVSAIAGRLDLFALGTDNRIYHATFDGTHESSVDWRALSGTFNSAPVVVSPDYNRIDVFAIGDDNRVWHKPWTGSAWQEWLPLGDSVFNCAPAVVTWRGQIEVFALGLEDNSVYRTYWKATDTPVPPNTIWSSLGGTFNPDP